MAVFGDDFYAGRPALTANRYGSGLAVYVASRIEEAFQDKLMWSLMDWAGIAREAEEPLPATVELLTRVDGEKRHVFLLNSGSESVEVSTKSFGKVKLAAFDVAVLGAGVRA